MTQILQKNKRLIGVVQYFFDSPAAIFLPRTAQGNTEKIFVPVLLCLSGNILLRSS